MPRNKNHFFLSFFVLIFFSSFLLVSKDDHFQGKKLFAELNEKEPFVMSVGTSMSQTHQTNNTVHKEFIRKAIARIINSLSFDEALRWIKDENRIWFVLTSLPKYTCQSGEILDPSRLDLKKDKELIDAILINLAAQQNSEKLMLSSELPEFCSGPLIEMDANNIVFDKEHQQAMIDQLQYLGVFDQFGVTKHNLPNFRLSLEMADVLKVGSDQLDPEKLKEQAKFINALGNPLLVFHHYANPAIRPYLFSEKEDVNWFANYCAEVIKLSPQITHVCPINQPIAFEYKVRKGLLPPFQSQNDKEMLDNITEAQIKAAQAMKKVNPKLKVLISHQWKPMKTLHTSLLDPRRYLETLICKIADNMYNKKFVEKMTPHLKYFDGIALSLYSPLYFDLWNPSGSNTSGKIDYQGALEAIIETSKAFPGKDIYVIETGCNTMEQEFKTGFIEMTLQACKVARDFNIPVKGVYFWGENNDPRFYFEWNAAPGSTHFGPFDDLNSANPIGSINAAGKYIKDILAYNSR